MVPVHHYNSSHLVICRDEYSALAVNVRFPFHCSPAPSQRRCCLLDRTLGTKDVVLKIAPVQPEARGCVTSWNQDLGNGERE